MYMAPTPTMKKFLSIVPILLIGLSGLSQQGAGFGEEVAEIRTRYAGLWDASRPTIVFTGSSSIRMWHDLDRRFSGHQVLNTGFGGSKFPDLENYLDALILDFAPVQVFIYEGDNDIWAGISRREILASAQRVIQRIKERLPQVEIVLISPKPSLSRWNLRGKYRRLNRRLHRLAEETPGVAYVDLWHPMLRGKKVQGDLFLEDGLHMNAKGYDIWYEQLKNLVE